jgi:diguanylate cyclase (GGDEF)-like protein
MFPSKLGLSPGTMHGAARNWLPRLHPDDRDRFRATLDVLLEHRRGRLNHEFRIRAEDGHYPLAVDPRPAGARLERRSHPLRRHDRRRYRTEEFDRPAAARCLHDNLTGLPNRQLFLDRLQGLLSLAPGGDTLRPTVITIDIDRYKLVNDMLGIAAGDNILIALTRRLRRLVKPQDTLARLAGDQFGLILMSERDPAKIADFADAISKAIMVPINFANREIILTASIGLAPGSTSRKTPPALLSDAELAMYRAKRAGGNRVEPFRPAFRDFGTDRLQLESICAARIERKELSLVYQPIVRLEDVEIAGFEALMRWEHPKRGNIPPSEFIPIAEELRSHQHARACLPAAATNDLMGWQNQTGELPIFVSVNLSSAQLLNNELYDDVRSVLAKTIAIRAPEAGTDRIHGHGEPGTGRLCWRN